MASAYCSTACPMRRAGFAARAGMRTRWVSVAAESGWLLATGARSRPITGLRVVGLSFAMCGESQPATADPIGKCHEESETCSDLAADLRFYEAVRDGWGGR